MSEIIQIGAGALAAIMLIYKAIDMLFLNNSSSGKKMCDEHGNLSRELVEIKTNTETIKQLARQYADNLEEIFNRLREVETRVSVVETKIMNMGL